MLIYVQKCVENYMYTARCTAVVSYRNRHKAIGVPYIYPCTQVYTQTYGQGHVHHKGYTKKKKKNHKGWKSMQTLTFIYTD